MEEERENREGGRKKEGRRAERKEGSQGKCHVSSRGGNIVF